MQAEKTTTTAESIAKSAPGRKSKCVETRRFDSRVEAECERGVDEPRQLATTR